MIYYIWRRLALGCAWLPVCHSSRATTWYLWLPTMDGVHGAKHLSLFPSSFSSPFSPLTRLFFEVSLLSPICIIVYVTLPLYGVFIWSPTSFSSSFSNPLSPLAYFKLIYLHLSPICMIVYMDDFLSMTAFFFNLLLGIMYNGCFEGIQEGCFSAHSNKYCPLTFTGNKY